jgi:hypothetical protein
LGASNKIKNLHAKIPTVPSRALVPKEIDIWNSQGFHLCEAELFFARPLTNTHKKQTEQQLIHRVGWNVN